MTTRTDVAARLTSDVAALLRRISRSNASSLARAGDALYATVVGDGLVHVTGAGHGLVLVLEAFYRAGGLACVNPIWDPSMLPLNGGRASTAAERRVGSGSALLAGAGVTAGDCLVVSSQSGINPVPVELAAHGRELGATVIAITSVAHGRSVASRDPSGRRLPDVADVVIDTCTPVGDAGFVVAPSAVPVAPLSTIATCHVWNLLLVAIAARARSEGLELPIWRSSNVPGGDAWIDELMGRYAERIPAL
jgi:uncharacterized phosphosugar-binding protein